MRADGRRLGRIIGQLDDIMALVDYYAGEESIVTPDAATPVNDVLGIAYHQLREVREKVQQAVDIVNREARAKADEDSRKRNPFFAPDQPGQGHGI